MIDVLVCRAEYAGYVVSVDTQQRLLSLYGYGAASRVRRFRVLIADGTIF